MRLTKKTKGSIYMYNFDTNCDDETREQRSIETHNKIIDKLGKLEDIEEELGISLIVLFKALKGGIWIKSFICFCGYQLVEKAPVFVKEIEIGYQDYTEVDENFSASIVDEKNVLCIYEHNYDYFDRCARIKDYGRTWALTKEELE